MKRIVFIGVISLLCSISALSQSKRKWEKTQAQNSITVYEDFIKKYPDGNYTSLATQQLEILRYNSVKEQNTIISYEAYLQKYINSPFATEAKQKLDDLIFKKAVTEGTIQSYENFVKQQKNSPHLSEVNQRLDDLYFKKVQAVGTIQAYESFLTHRKKSKYNLTANQQLDDLYYKKAEADGTILSYESFLNLRKNSKYILMANQHLDDLYFKKAEADGTIQSYENFLKQSKNSTHTSEVNLRLGLLYMERDWLNVIETNQISDYDEFLNQYDNSPHKQEASNRKQLLIEKQTEFEGLLRKGSIQNLTDFCKKNPDSPYLPKAESAIMDLKGARNIVDLLDEGKIEIKTQGEGIETVSISIRKLVPYPITVQIPVGSFFVSERSSAQNMVATAQRKVQLTNSDWQTLSVPGACANRPRDIPGGDDSFSVQRSPFQDELTRLMPVLNKSGVGYSTRQAAVWIVTDDADYYDLGILVNRSQYDYYGGTRAINEVAAARAMKICADAGIDIYSKRIWSDRQEILEGLKDPKLKSIIKNLEKDVK
jgi:outer membrane protein assembly factor BamD (BamD/ComL family)